MTRADYVSVSLPADLAAAIDKVIASESNPMGFRKRAEFTASAVRLMLTTVQRQVEFQRSL